jgi:uncharacterized protein YciI
VAVTSAYAYLMRDQAARVREIAPRHTRYWSETGSAERGGPFAARSGGLIIFDAVDEDAAERMVAGDPFQREALLEQWWLKAWAPTEHDATPYALAAEIEPFGAVRW